MAAQLNEMQLETNRVAAAEIVAASDYFARGKMETEVFLLHVTKIVGHARFTDVQPSPVSSLRKTLQELRDRVAQQKV